MSLSKIIGTLGSQSEAARRIGVSQPAVNGWVHGKALPTPLAQRAIAAATGRTVEEIRALVDAERSARGAAPELAAVGPVAEGPVAAFAGMVTAWLESKGLNPFRAQPHLAATDTTIASWAAGHTLPPLSRAPALAVTLGRTADEVAEAIRTDRSARGTAPAPAAVGPVAEGT